MKVKRGLLALEARPRTIVQHLAIDQFGELPARKRAAKADAEKRGHRMGAWHRRKNDEYGRWDSWCERDGCTRVAVVAVEPPTGLGLVYGNALTARCEGRL